MTKPEVLLWLKIRKDQLGYRIHRQFPVGNYILDFYCRKLKVAIEVDGHDHDFRVKKDQVRDQWLQYYGITTFRIQASTVLKNPEYAAELIRQYLNGIDSSNSANTQENSDADQ